MSENATVTTQETPATEQGRTFTQDELNAIVGKRLAENSAKYADYEDLKAKAAELEEAKKAVDRANDLQKQLDALTEANKARELRDRVAEETGVPSKLLRGSSEEDLREQAKAILGFAQASRPTYPSVKDGGETIPPTISKADILAIKDERKRLEAIKQNIDLFG